MFSAFNIAIHCLCRPEACFSYSEFVDGRKTNGVSDTFPLRFSRRPAYPLVNFRAGPVTRLVHRRNDRAGLFEGEGGTSLRRHPR